jgi:SPX domain protein involved in polyphosphate accumulation
MDMYKLIGEFQKEKYDTCTEIKNVELFKEKIQKIYIETARNCRWITMSKPSEIIFIEKSMSSE